MLNTISLSYFAALRLLNFALDAQAVTPISSLWLGLHKATTVRATIRLSEDNYTIPVTDNIGDHAVVNAYEHFGDWNNPLDTTKILLGHPPDRVGSGGYLNPAPYTGLGHEISTQVQQIYPGVAPFDALFVPGDFVKFSPSLDGFTVLEPTDAEYARVPVSFDAASVLYPTGVIARSSEDCNFAALSSDILATYFTLWDAQVEGHFLGAGEIGVRAISNVPYGDSTVPNGAMENVGTGRPMWLPAGTAASFPAGSIGLTFNANPYDNGLP